MSDMSPCAVATMPNRWDGAAVPLPDAVSTGSGAGRDDGRMKQIHSAGLAGMLMSSAALAGTSPAHEPPQARIAFADHGSIDHWQADGRSALYIQGPGNQWYHAKLLGYCPDLDFANAIGFETRGSGDFDSFSSIVVNGRRCALSSLVKSGPPPKKTKGGKRASKD